MYTYIKIEDNGVGMSRNVQDRIFEPFFTTKDKGSGVGLSIVYGFIQSVKGYISTKSVMGEGTMFYILIPNE